MHTWRTMHTHKEKQEKQAKEAKWSGTAKVAKRPKEGKQHKRRQEKREKRKRTQNKKQNANIAYPKTYSKKKTRAERTKHCVKRGIMAVENSATTRLKLELPK